jgi:hypothetical protein
VWLSTRCLFVRPRGVAGQTASRYPSNLTFPVFPSRYRNLSPPPISALRQSQPSTNLSPPPISALRQSQPSTNLSPPPISALHQSQPSANLSPPPISALRSIRYDQAHCDLQAHHDAISSVCIFLAASESEEKVALKTGQTHSQ